MCPSTTTATCGKSNIGGLDLAKTLVEIGTDAQTTMIAVMMPRLKTDSQRMHITIFLTVSKAGLKYVDLVLFNSFICFLLLYSALRKFL